MNPTTGLGSVKDTRSTFPPQPQEGHAGRGEPAKEEVDTIRRLVEEADSGAVPAHHRGRVRAMVIFFISRSVMIPMLVFLIIPQRAATAAAPLFAFGAKQLAQLAVQMAAIGRQIGQQMSQPFSLLSRVGSNLADTVRTSIERLAERFQQMSDAFIGGLARLTQPLRQLPELLAQKLDHALHKLLQLAQYPKDLAAALKNAFANRANKLAESMTSPFSRLGKRLADAAQKLRLKVREGLEKGYDRVTAPIRKAYEAVTKAAEAMTAAVVTQLQATAQPVINFFAGLTQFSRELKKGSMRGLKQMMQAVANKVQSAIQRTNHFVARLYHQVLVDKMILPLLAPFQRAWKSGVALKQQIQAKIAKQLNRMRQAALRHYERVMNKVQKAMTSLFDQAKKKWREQLLPRIKKIPQQVKALTFATFRSFITIWRRMLQLFLQIARVIRDILQYLAEMMKEAIAEIMTQSRSHS